MKKYENGKKKNKFPLNHHECYMIVSTVKEQKDQRDLSSYFK